MKQCFFIFIALLLGMTAKAQDIRITDFHQNVTSLVASMNPVKDRTGAACAVIRFAVKDKRVKIETNLGVVKTVKRPGELLLYVPQGTKRITVRCSGMMPLRDWQIPVAIESKATYDAVVELSEEAAELMPRSGENRVYVGAGYNIMSLSGPSVLIGFNMGNHHLELGAAMGLKKSDDLFFYGGDGSLKAAYSYKSTQVNASYGWELRLKDIFSLMPMAGVSYNLISGKAVSGVTTTGGGSELKNGNSVSGVFGLRLAAGVSEMVEVHITPSFHMGLFKDNNCKLLNTNDSKIKRWTDGANLNVGLNVKF